MNYKVTYNLSHNELLRYRKLSYKTDWTKYKFIFNIHKKINYSLIEKNFDPSFVMTLFDPIHYYETIVIDVTSNDILSIRNQNESVFGHYILYSTHVFCHLAPTYSYRDIFKTISRQGFRKEEKNYEIKKGDITVYDQGYFEDTQSVDNIVCSNTPELGFYKPVLLKKLTYSI